MSLIISDVCHRYGSDPWILTDVSMVLEPGVVAALVGPSGSGKSTLLAIAGLLLKPRTGSVLYSDSPTGARPDKRHRDDVAWVFQTSNLLPRRSALENAMMGPLSRGCTVEEARTRATHALAKVGVEHLADIDVRHISGGEAQRVGVARGLAARPTYLFADEPTGQLDQAATSVVVAALGRRRNTGSVTLIATHDMGVAGSCDRVYTLRDGHIVGSA